VTGALAEPRCIDLPVFDCAQITDGRGHIHREVAIVDLDITDPDHARRGEPGGWVRAARRAATAVHTRAIEAELPAIVVFASRHPLWNTNSVGLAWRERYSSAMGVQQLLTDEGDTVSAYLRRLADPQHGQPPFLFVTDPCSHDFRPRVTQGRAARAAECLGFEVTATVRLPDGRTARLFERREPLPSTTTEAELRALTRACTGRDA
jgi:hypothetical protein